MISASEQWQHNRRLAAAYDAAMKRKRVARALGALIWGTDARHLWEDIAKLGEVPDGRAVLDIPCGGGIAFRGLRPAHPLRYVAVDISPEMLERARVEAERRRLDWIEFAQADVHALPFADETFDLCISYNSLHCFPRPQTAVTEMARVLKPQGILRGSTCISGGGSWRDGLVSFYRRKGFFGEVGRPTEVHCWLEGAGFEEACLELSGAVAYFCSQKRGAATASM